MACGLRWVVLFSACKVRANAAQRGADAPWQSHRLTTPRPFGGRWRKSARIFATNVQAVVAGRRSRSRIGAICASVVIRGGAARGRCRHRLLRRSQASADPMTKTAEKGGRRGGGEDARGRRCTDASAIRPASPQIKGNHRLSLRVLEPDSATGGSRLRRSVHREADHWPARRRPERSAADGGPSLRRANDIPARRPAVRGESERPLLNRGKDSPP